MTPAGKETARTPWTPGSERWTGKEDDSASSAKQDADVEVDEEARPQNSVHLHAGLQDRRRHRVQLTGGLLQSPGVFGVLAVHLGARSVGAPEWQSR